MTYYIKLIMFKSKLFKDFDKIYESPFKKPLQKVGSPKNSISSIYKNRPSVFNTIKKDKVSLNMRQVLFHAGDIPPSQKIREKGYVYGFSNIDFARGWKNKHGKKYIYQFVAEDWSIDPFTYSRQVPGGVMNSDNEYIVRNVSRERLIE